MTDTRITRRALLRQGAGLGVGAVCGGLLTQSGCGGQAGGLLVAGAPVATNATVGVALGRDLRMITLTALDRIGGIHTIVQPGESVFVKASFLTAGLKRDDHTSTGEITKPEVALAVAEACLVAGAREVIVGDGSQVEAFDWTELRTLDGRSHIAAEAAALSAKYDDRLRLAQLNSDSPDWTPLPSRRTNLGQIHVSSLVAKADRIISVPVLKTHHLAHVSLSLKNFMGVPPISRYGGGSEAVGRFVLHQCVGGLQGAFLDMVDGLRPDLAVIDASIGVEGYGPWVRPREGRTVDLRERLGDWMVLASTDLVAADVTATRIIGQDYRGIPYLRNAYAQGLGQALAEQIALVGANLEDLRMEWEPAWGVALIPPSA